MRRVAGPVERRDPQMLDVVQALCVFAAQLPEYTRKAGALRPVSEKVRDVLLSATEPSTMLFNHLPAACGLEPFTTFETADDARAAHFVELLQDALNDLRNDYPRLLHRIQDAVATSIGQCDDGLDRGVLAQRAARVQAVATHNRLKTFATRLRDPQLTDEQWSIAVASFVLAKTPAKWSAIDEARCLEEITELSQRFNRVETAAFAQDGQAQINKAAMLLKLTQASGHDRGLVVQSTLLSAKGCERLKIVRGSLGDNRTERLQILANLIWDELADQAETEADETAQGAQSA